jgi:CHAD domain-containing protein
MDHKKEKLHRTVEHRFDKTETALKKITEDFTEDNIHDFRVEIKKLKAFVRLMGYGIPGNAEPKFPKPLNKFYKALGSLREWQIQKTKILKAAGEMQYSGPQLYVQKIDRKMAASNQKAITLMKKIPDIKKMMEKIHIRDSEEPGAASMVGFIHSRIQRVKEILHSGKKDDESMHEIRKKIKDIQYILSGVGKSGEIEEHSSTLASVQDVSALLGDYHDLCVSVALLKKELNSIPKETSEKKLLLRLEAQWLDEKQKSCEHTIQSTQSLIETHFSEQHLN